MERIPLLLPSMPSADALLPFLRRIDDNRQYTNFGPLCLEFETWLAQRAPARDGGWAVTTTANATLALELALQACDLAPGARVLLPAITFVASATAVLRRGLVPVIADVDADSWLLTPAIADAVLARGVAFDAVMPVATFGAAQDMAAWDDFVRRTGLPVLVDAAGAFGNQVPGERADVVYSFHATKAFGAGEGGAIVSASASRVERARRLSNFGIDTRVGELVDTGTNAKMSEYHCAVALAAAATWDDTARARRALHASYAALLQLELPQVALQRKDPATVNSLLTVRLPCDAAPVAASLDAAGIGTRRWYCPPLHRHPALAGQPVAGDLPVAGQLGDRLLGLPFFLGLDQDRMARVVASLAAALREAECST